MDWWMDWLIPTSNELCWLLCNRNREWYRKRSMTWKTSLWRRQYTSSDVLCCLERSAKAQNRAFFLVFAYLVLCAWPSYVDQTACWWNAPRCFCWVFFLKWWITDSSLSSSPSPKWAGSKARKSFLLREVRWKARKSFLLPKARRKARKTFWLW